MCSPVRIRYSCNHPSRQIGKKTCIYAKFIKAYHNPGSQLSLKYAKFIAESKLNLKYGIDIYRKECKKCLDEETYVDKQKLCGACSLGKKRGGLRDEGKRKTEKKKEEKRRRRKEGGEKKEEREDNAEDDLEEVEEEEGILEELAAYLERMYDLGRGNEMCVP
jgi:hypothetical protein